MSEEQPPSILYVDDDEVNRHTFTWILQNAGFQTREATNGSDALRLAEEKPDLIILDVSLPDMDGFEVCRRIKSHPATAAIPVLHMSGVFVSTEDKTHGLEGGADGYLTKPVEPREVVATVRSLLRIHKAEEAARTAANQWQATFDAIHDPLCVLDRAGRLLRANQALAVLLHRPVADLVGASYLDLVEQTFGAAAAPLGELLHGAAPPSQDLLLGDRWFRVTLDPIPDEHGQVAGHVHLLADVTRRKVLEEQLRQAQKMEAVGRLAGGVAHDFNNLLTAITGNLSLLLAEVPEGDPRRELLRTTEKAAWRAADLTRQLLGFSRRTQLWLQPTDLNRCVEETMAILQRTFDPRIEIVVKAAPDLWVVQADPNQINQVVMNLCLNARDAMREGGRLTVETANVSVSEEHLPKPAAGAEMPRTGNFVRLRVRDSGHGIPEEIQHRIFDPFFTTKEQGQGTGLGLAMVFGIVKQHQGWIEFQSSARDGTCFDIYLPRYTVAGA